MASLNYIKKIRTDTEIFWGLVIFEIAIALGFSTVLIFSGILIYIICIFISSRKVIIPRIQSIWPYIIFIIYGTVVGLVKFGTRDVSRGLYYILPSVVLILLGYLLTIMYPKKSIQKTICLLAMVGTIASFFNFIIHISEIENIDNIRIYMGAMNSEATVALILIFTNKFLFKKVYFSKIIDTIMFIAIAVKIVMSLGRVTVGETVIGIVASFIITIIIDKKKRYFSGVVAISILAVIFIITFSLLPQEATESFSEKVENSSVEVNSDLEFNSIKESVEHWRGYEMQEARNQWKKGSGLEMIFGQGIGQSIAVRYIPPSWNRDLLDGNRLPILHNSYYFMLVVGGIFGVFALIYLMAGGIILLIKHRKSPYKQDLAVIATMSVCILFNTYFTRGIVTQSLILGWPLLYGSINMTLNRMDDSDSDEGDAENQ